MREVLAWLVLALTILVPIWWGAHGHWPWDVDNIAPGPLLRRMASRFAVGQLVQYPPLPYYLMAVVYSPALGIMRLVQEFGVPSGAYPWGFKHPESSMTILVVLARLVTAVLAAGIVWLSVRRAHADGLSRDGWIVPILALGAPTFLYYGRTTNTDVHYVFWLFLGFGLLEARVTRNRLFALVGAAVAATLSVASKDQAFSLAAVIIGTAAFRAWSRRTTSIGAVAARGATPGNSVVRQGSSPDWRAGVIVLLSALLAYAVVWRLPWDWVGFVRHIRFEVTGGGSEQGGGVDPRHFALTPAGIAGIAWRYLQLSPVIFGWPIAIGVVAAIILRAGLRGLGPRSLAFAVYLATMLGVGYVRPKFALPLMVLLLPLAARGMAAAFSILARRARPLLAPATAALVLLALWGGPRLSAAMLTDPRLPAERWIASHAPAHAVVEIGGNPRWQARVPPSMQCVVTTRLQLWAVPRGPVGDLVLISSLDRWKFETDPRLRSTWWEPLHSGGPGGNYRVAARFDPPWFVSDLAALPIAPTIWIYARE